MTNEKGAGQQTREEETITQCSEFPSSVKAIGKVKAHKTEDENRSLSCSSHAVPSDWKCSVSVKLL